MGIGPAIRRLRGDMTQAELARRTHVSRERISQLESGSTLWPGPDVFNDLARALDAPVNVLLAAGGIRFPPAPRNEELAWLESQLDQEGQELLVQLGRALLPQHRRRQETGNVEVALPRP